MYSCGSAGHTKICFDTEFNLKQIYFLMSESKLSKLELGVQFFFILLYYTQKIWILGCPRHPDTPLAKGLLRLETWRQDLPHRGLRLVVRRSHLGLNLRWFLRDDRGVRGGNPLLLYQPDLLPPAIRVTCFTKSNADYFQNLASDF